MNGIKPNFLKEFQLTSDYYKKPNPYIDAPSCHVNLLEMSGYAKKHKKRLADLSVEEVEKFSI